MEDSLTLEELYLLANTQQLREHRIIRKLGAIQGVDIPDLDAGETDEPKEDFRERIENRLREESGRGATVTSGMTGVGYQQI